MSRARQIPYRLVLFDFDGTLADSAASLLTTLTSITAELDVASPVSMARALLPDADSQVLLRKLGIPLLSVPQIRSHLQTSWARADTVPLVAGMEMLLLALADAGVELGVVSGRPLPYVRHALGEAADRVRYYGCGLAFLTKGERIELVLEESRRLPEEVLYVGDELCDLRAAEDHAVPCALVGWGFLEPAVLAWAGAAHVVETVEALEQLLLAPAPSPALRLSA
jgi:phosphoglycolate phosphatase